MAAGGRGGGCRGGGWASVLTQGWTCAEMSDTCRCRAPYKERWAAERGVPVDTSAAILQVDGVPE